MPQDRDPSRDAERPIRKRGGLPPARGEHAPAPRLPAEKLVDAESEAEEVDSGELPEAESVPDFGASGRHQRGFTSTQEFEPRYGRTLGEGTWRSADDQGEDRSGRAGFGWEDVEPETLEDEDAPLESPSRADLGTEGVPAPGLSGSGAWGEARGAAKALAAEDDDAIRARLLDVLARHPELDSRNVDVEVLDGQVVLRGRVPDVPTRRELQSLAGQVTDPRQVTVDLDVVPASG